MISPNTLNDIACSNLGLTRRQMMLCRYVNRYGYCRISAGLFSFLRCSENRVYMDYVGAPMPVGNYPK